MNSYELWREKLLKTVLVVGGLILLVFPVIYYLQGKVLIAILEVVCGLFLWGSLAVVAIKHMYLWPARVGWLGVLLALTAVLFTGGIGGTGLLWWSMLPVISFVLFQKRGGLKAVLLGMVVIVFVESLRFFGFQGLYFEFKEVLMMLVMIGTVTVVMYNYEKISGEARDESMMKADMLEEEIQSKGWVEKELSENLVDLGIEKDKQVKIRSAMINLLEDAKELEVQLKEEKGGVEKKVEERTAELQKEKAKLDSSIENLPVGYMMIDVNEKVIVANPLVSKMLGEKSELLMLEKLKVVLKDKFDLDHYIKSCDGETKSVTFPDLEIDGRYVQILLSPILTISPTVAAIGIVVLVQDVTEAKNLERSKDEFFSIASHELRTPLTAIRGNTAMILEYYKDVLKDPELKSMVDDVHESSIRLINIVNDFLNASRLEQNKMKYQIEKFEIDGIILETLKDYEIIGTKKEVSINYLSQNEKIPLVLADPDKVRQILTNLVGNALKFTPEKGSVEVSARVFDGFVKILVTDTGRGISSKQQSMLFHKFQQANESLFTRDTAGGSGLGLYISKMMVEGMGGEIKLENSVEGLGTTFSFSLPLGN